MTTRNSLIAAALAALVLGFAWGGCSSSSDDIDETRGDVERDASADDTSGETRDGPDAAPGDDASDDDAARADAATNTTDPDAPGAPDTPEPEDTEPGDDTATDPDAATDTTDDPVGTVRRVRIVSEESDSWISWREIEVWGVRPGETDAANLALGASVSASSEEAGQPAAHAVDGDQETAWNAGGFPPASIEIGLGEPVEIREIRLLVAQNPSGRTRHVVQLASVGDFETVHTFDEHTTNGSWLVYRAVSTTPGECGPMSLNLIMQQIEQPCSDCSIWFWDMGVPEQRPRLELEHVVDGVTTVAQFQTSPRGTDGDLHAARILGEPPYWGPGACEELDEDCRSDFAHHFQARGTVDGAPLWHGILFGDLSPIPCDATITRAHLHLHINEDEGLANADHTSVVALHRGLREWDPVWVTGTRYAKDPVTGANLPWTTPGGDFGELVLELHAQRDFWDRGFNKANPRAWFDFTDHVAQLQRER